MSKVRDYKNGTWSAVGAAQDRIAEVAQDQAKIRSKALSGKAYDQYKENYDKIDWSELRMKRKGRYIDGKYVVKESDYRADNT